MVSFFLFLHYSVLRSLFRMVSLVLLVGKYIVYPSTHPTQDTIKTIYQITSKTKQMDTTIIVEENLSKSEKYALLKKYADSLMKDEPDLIANMANIAALIMQIFDFHWVGFYRLIGDELVLGPFQGPVACTRIKIPNGVCGKAVQDKKTIIVENVHDFPGHIACSALSNSEIVVPYIQNGEVQWVLDIDSTSFDDFNEVDKGGLDNIISLGNSLNC